MSEFFKFLITALLVFLDFYLLILSLKTIVHMQFGGNGLVSKRWAMSMKTGMVGFVIALFAFLLGTISYFFNQKWVGFIAVFIMFVGLALGFYAGLGSWFLLLTGRNRKDIEITSDWDFWKFLK